MTKDTIELSRTHEEYCGYWTGVPITPPEMDTLVAWSKQSVNEHKRIYTHRVRLEHENVVRVHEGRSDAERVWYLDIYWQ